jgi:UDP-glucose 4-epimerase
MEEIVNKELIHTPPKNLSCDPMKVVVTGSSGHLGEALVRVLAADGHDVVGLDLLSSPFTAVTGSITDRSLVRDVLAGADGVIHSATLHKPHVGTHSRQEFLDVNVTGTLTMLEVAADVGVQSFVYASTTSAFGRALVPAAGDPAAWITEDVAPVPKNVYGTTKTAAENLCELVAGDTGLPCVVLRLARFFPEEDDAQTGYESLNLKVNELLYRRVDLTDAVDACRLALARAPTVGFGRYVVSATTPFSPDDLSALRIDAPAVVRRYCPAYEDVYERLGWRMLPSVDRVYVNERARRALGWCPVHTFRHAIDRLAEGEDPRSALALTVGAKGYHDEPTGVYTTEARP